MSKDVESLKVIIDKKYQENRRIVLYTNIIIGGDDKSSRSQFISFNQQEATYEYINENILVQTKTTAWFVPLENILSVKIT